MVEASDSDLARIATNFILAAPPGELMEIVTDVRALLPRESLLNDSAKTTFKTYNEDQLIQVTAADGHKLLICKQAEVGENRYIDPVGNSIVTFDHIKQEITGTKGISGELDGEMEGMRQALEKAAATYTQEQFQFGTCGVYSNKTENCFYICIASSKFNPTNFWNGRWRSIWTVPNKSGNVNMTGRVRAQVHYYEAGNVQLQVDANKKVAVSMADAAGVIKAIIKAEQAMQLAIDNSYATMGETTFKALRRPLPISHQKINWNLIRSYRLGSEVSGSST